MLAQQVFPLATEEPPQFPGGSGTTRAAKCWRSTNVWNSYRPLTWIGSVSYLGTGLAVVGQQPDVSSRHVVSLTDDGRCHAQVETCSPSIVLPSLRFLLGPGSADRLPLRREPVQATHWCTRRKRRSCWGPELREDSTMAPWLPVTIPTQASCPQHGGAHPQHRPPPRRGTGGGKCSLSFLAAPRRRSQAVQLSVPTARTLPQPGSPLLSRGSGRGSPPERD